MASVLTRENVYTIGLGLAAVLVVRMIAGWIRRPKYLPGPRRLPFVGNLFDMPESEAWVTYKKWKEDYGTSVLDLCRERQA